MVRRQRVGDERPPRVRTGCRYGRGARSASSPPPSTYSATHTPSTSSVARPAQSRAAASSPRPRQVQLGQQRELVGRAHDRRAAPGHDVPGGRPTASTRRYGAGISTGSGARRTASTTCMNARVAAPAGRAAGRRDPTRGRRGSPAGPWPVLAHLGPAAALEPHPPAPVVQHDAAAGAVDNEVRLHLLVGGQRHRHGDRGAVGGDQAEAGRVVGLDGVRAEELHLHLGTPRSPQSRPGRARWRWRGRTGWSARRRRPAHRRGRAALPTGHGRSTRSRAATRRRHRCRGPPRSRRRP